MDVQEVFKCLTSNKFLPGFDYQTKFSFQTLFYHDRYSYCCCECAFEHEYLDYVLEAGDIVESVYRKTLESILKGKCPHVDNVDQSYLRETSISATHIAAALGTIETIRDYIEDFPQLTGGVFSLTPFQLAILRQNPRIVQLMLCRGVTSLLYLHVTDEIMYCHRTNGFSTNIVKELVSPPVYCAKKRNELLLRSILNTNASYTDVHKALEFILEHNIKGMEQDLISYIRSQYHHMLCDCMVSAVVYDRPDILKKLLNSCDSPRIRHLTEICRVIKRQKCADMLRSYEPLSEFIKPYIRLTGLNLLHQNFIDFSHNILPDLKATNFAENWINEKYVRDKTRLHHSVSLRPEEVKVLLELGADVDSVDDCGYTPLMHLVSQRSHDTVQSAHLVRYTVGLLLQENPSLALNKNLVELAIERDEENIKPLPFRQNRCGEYIMDAKEHSLIDISHPVDQSLIFLGPLLIESGFPVSRDVLHNALEKNLHRVEKAYIRKCLHMPRSLKLMCRDKIRKHFHRHHLNHFVNIADLPNLMKDFILLKDLF